jgi:acyl-CoA dehydrogenase
MFNSIIPLLGVMALAALAGLILVRPIRRALISRPLFATYRKVLPQMSDTERDALEAGTVWWEGELFRGKPDWQKLHGYPQPKLTAEEQSFLDNECEEACRLVDDWKVTQELYDLPNEAWRYIKTKGFLGMIIPKKYGGLEFSAYAHSQVITKLSTRSSALAVSVMVPNSLGPAELLLHYGTDEQKAHYLPRLAKGVEIPAFALTSPWAGSDAASIPDSGVVCKGMYQGKEVLGMRVNWDKRYITLAPVCTVFGLAFHLYDPDGLLGNKKHIGITCALVPYDHPGVETGRRHFPLNAMFMNGPTRGKDVFMPLDFIIGGPKMAGGGWRMLMECLAAGRSISLPSSNTGMAQMTARAVGGYARVRSQFKMAVGKFEGVEEALTRIGAYTYMMDAVRKMTAGAVDLGEKPSVVSAIAKYHVTERARQVVNDGMDVIGGKGICLGPSNFMGRAYQQVPVAITVEGANILTRSLIIFGQGAIRCHPFLLAEMQSAQNPDVKKGLVDFDKALWAHVGFTIKNGFRALWLGMTGSHFVTVNVDTAPEMRRYYQQMTRFSAIWDAMYKAQEAFDGVIANFPIRFIAAFLHRSIFPWGHPYVVPSDEVGHQVAKLLIAPSASRDRLTAECFIPQTEKEPIGAIELALHATLEAEAIEAKIRVAEKNGRFENNPQANVRDIAIVAAECGVITAAEFEIMKRRNALRDIVVHVDDFPFDYNVATANKPAESRMAA